MCADAVGRGSCTATKCRPRNEIRNCRAGTCIDACEVCGTQRATPKKIRAGAGMRRLAQTGAVRFALAASARRRRARFRHRGSAPARQHRCDGLARRPGRRTGACAWPPRPRCFPADRNSSSPQETRMRLPRRTFGTGLAAATLLPARRARSRVSGQPDHQADGALSGGRCDRRDRTHGRGGEVTKPSAASTGARP